MYGKSILVAALAAAALAPAGAAEARTAGAPVEAHAAGFKTAKFVAYVEGKQVTTWNVPRYNTYFDCQGQRWHESKGEEVIRWRTKPAKVLVFMGPSANAPQIKIGTWSLFNPSTKYDLTGSGNLTRKGLRVDGIEPSVCHDAGDPVQDDHGPYDCGERPYDPSVNFGWRGNRVEVSAANLVRPLTGVDGFVNCPVEGPIKPDEGEWTNISQRYPVRDVFDRSQGLVEVLGRKSWTEKIHRDHGTATTTTTFKLRLRRAG